MLPVSVFEVIRQRERDSSGDAARLGFRGGEEAGSDGMHGLPDRLKVLEVGVRRGAEALELRVEVDELVAVALRGGGDGEVCVEGVEGSFSARGGKGEVGRRGAYEGLLGLLASSSPTFLMLSAMATQEVMTSVMALPASEVRDEVGAISFLWMREFIVSLMIWCAWRRFCGGWGVMVWEWRCGDSFAWG